MDSRCVMSPASLKMFMAAGCCCGRGGCGRGVAEGTGGRYLCVCVVVLRVWAVCVCVWEAGLVERARTRRLGQGDVGGRAGFCAPSTRVEGGAGNRLSAECTAGQDQGETVLQTTCRVSSRTGGPCLSTPSFGNDNAPPPCVPQCHSAGPACNPYTPCVRAQQSCNVLPLLCTRAPQRRRRVWQGCRAAACMPSARAISACHRCVPSVPHPVEGGARRASCRPCCGGAGHARVLPPGDLCLPIHDEPPLPSACFRVRAGYIMVCPPASSFTWMFAVDGLHHHQGLMAMRPRRQPGHHRGRLPAGTPGGRSVGREGRAHISRHLERPGQVSGPATPAAVPVECATVDGEQHRSRPDQGSLPCHSDVHCASAHSCKYKPKSTRRLTARLPAVCRHCQGRVNL